ncbi:MAG: hypothetical protein KAH38_02520 [Candidatus Hydrogenedentes bacterium]|nr:hypothetical protein [Candidatus Hydrogenedentota bacterium]
MTYADTKRRIILALIFIGLSGCQSLHTQKAASKDSKGTGTAENPYILYTIEEVQAIGKNKDSLSAHYRLGCDIDASNTINWNDGAGLTPIGSTVWKEHQGNDSDYQGIYLGFNGTFDGSGYTINNLYINLSKTPFGGLFDILGKSACIKNLGLQNCNISVIYKYPDDATDLCSAHAGGITGSNFGTVINCHVTGNISALLLDKEDHSNEGPTEEIQRILSDTSAYAGGIAGCGAGIVVNCFSEGKFSATAKGERMGAYAGGIIGDTQVSLDLYLMLNISRGIVTTCHSNGNVSAVSLESIAQAGGIIGRNGSIIDNCFATGTVSTTGHCSASGGLVGDNKHIVYCSYATGNATAVSTDCFSYAGGLSGTNDSIINNCYATGNISASSESNKVYAGGGIGRNENLITNSYATGSVSAVGGSELIYMGGFSGYNKHGTIKDCFWDINTSDTEVSDGGTGLTTQKMLQEDTFTAADWDFMGTWIIVPSETYPYLKTLGIIQTQNH